MRENAGYEIIYAIQVGNREIVFGKNKAGHYVTWECTGGFYYYWGHYFTDELSALEDFGRRISELAELLWRCRYEYRV